MASIAYAVRGETIPMDSRYPSAWLSTVAEPLTSQFGAGLSVYRDGNAVRWAYAGQSALIELRADGKMHAIFIDREGVDAVSNRPAAAAYRTYAAYALNQGSCADMIADMVDFFSGVREPKFTFFGAYSR